MPYTVPTASDLQTRYPAFAAVADATVDYWIADAQRVVATSWAEADYAPGLMALAAHNMALQGLGSAGGAIPAGVTRFKSGSMEVAFSDAAASAQASGGLGATRYGIEFRTMLRRNSGGIGIVRGSTALPCGCA